MSLVIHIYYTGKPGMARQFAAEMERSGTAAEIRRRPGNEGYAYFFPAGDEDTVLLIDKWRDQEALDAHHASPMMETIARLREKYDLHMKVERFRTEEEEEAPASDQAFIRE